MRETRLSDARRLPHVISAVRGSRNLADFLQLERAGLPQQLLQHGALLFRGFDVFSVERFDAALTALAASRLDYLYRSTPRTALGGRVFTATEYPAEQSISLHCENAYQRQWPLKVAFCCLLPAASGGETPLADVRRVTARLNPGLLDRFEARQVRYVRHYRPHVDLPWQTVFQISDRQELAEFCARSDIAHEWLDQETLRTTQVCQGTARHPVTGERLWFNQAHLFHASSMGAQTEQTLVQVFGRDRLPRNAYFGDGAEIDAGDLAAVRSVFQEEAVTFPWEVGDVLLLDNMLVAHGRRPFRGERKVVAALLDPSEPPVGNASLTSCSQVA